MNPNVSVIRQTIRVLQDKANTAALNGGSCVVIPVDELLQFCRSLLEFADGVENLVIAAEIWASEKAFPGGISLRDRFAGQALAGIATSLSEVQIWEHSWQVDKFSAAAYLLADAMLEARKQ